MEKPQKKGGFEAPGLSLALRGTPEGTSGLGEAPCWVGGQRGKQQLGKHIEGLKAVIPLCNRGYSAKPIEGKSVTRAIG